MRGTATPRSTDDEGADVKAWTAAQLESDDGVLRFAKAFRSYSWTSSLGGFGGLGDTVAKRNTRAAVNGLDEIMNRSRFRERVEQLAGADLPTADKSTIQTFLDAWIRRDKNPKDKFA